MVLCLRVVPVALASIALVGGSVAASPPSPTVQVFSVALSGQAPVSRIRPSGGTGDMDASGMVRLSVDPDKRQICYDFKVTGLSTPLMAHIHRGPALSNGPTVVTLFTGPGGEMRNCLLWSQPRLAEIVTDASNFYVSLSTTEYPDGALRGQLA